MSWIIGVAGHCPAYFKKSIISLSGETLFQFENNNIFICGGGNADTFISGKNRTFDFAVCGLGINFSYDQTYFLNQSDWLQQNIDTVKNLNGHFVFIQWNKYRLKLTSDKFGLRDIYVYKFPNGAYLFSTRSDWISKITGSKLNFSIFGSRWLLFNQISDESIFENITRVSNRTIYSIDLESLSSETIRSNWLDEIADKHFTSDDFKNIFDQLTNFPRTNDIKLNLSLSGGMDSRVILSQLLKHGNNFTSHTFGCPQSADSIIAKRISQLTRVPNETINMRLPEVDNCLSELRNYVSQSLVNNSVSSYFQLRNYDYFKNKNEVLIDGGFGEIWRREFFNRIVISGRTALFSKDVRSIIPYLRIPRADIFNREINDIMLIGCQEQIENIFQELPDIKKVGIENWIDLFGIKTRLQNYYSFEQIRSDGIIRSYMPYVQPVLLINIIALNLSERRNGKLFKELIKTNYSLLKNIPLAKGELTHPYWFGTITTRAYLIARKKFYQNLAANNYSKKLIDYLSVPIQDYLNSVSLNDIGLYNTNKLRSISNRFFNKKLTFEDYQILDWWLVFEIFRKDNPNLL